MARLNSDAVLRPLRGLFETGTHVGSSDAQLLESFVARRDETAFEALVIRHGRSVHALCRDILRDPHDAEDAFQATFLILARKAGSLWVGDSLAAWLHRVAHRVAVEANRQKARRRAVEKTGLETDMESAGARDHRASLVRLLHEEIARLPEKYRAPIVLCDLEELTRDEAACRLGWPPGTVAGRLARARSLLRDRLARRGRVELDGLMAIAGAGRGMPGTVPASWIEGVFRLATSSGAGSVGMSRSMGAVAGLARGVSTDMTLARFRSIAIVAGLASAFGVLTLAVTRSAIPQAKSTGSSTAPSQRVEKPAGAPGRVEPSPAKAAVSGSIVLRDGTPAGGVRIFFSTWDNPYSNGRVRVEKTADEQGQFSLEFPGVESPWKGTPGTGTLWAYRPGSLVATIPVYRGNPPAGSPLRLVVGPPARALFEVHGPDDKPLAGARIEPVMLDRHNSVVPDPLAALIGADTVTDANGRAVMAAFFPEETRGIRVAAPGYGRQRFTFGFERISPDPKVVRLRPVGRLKGRLVGDPAAIRRCPLRVIGFSPPNDPAPFSYNDEITADDEGRFEIPALAIGPTFVRTVQRSDFPWYGAGKEGITDVKPGQTTEVVLPLKRSVRVHGVVREQGTQRPVAGVRMAVALDETESMTTNEAGIYQGYMVPGEVADPTPLAVLPGYAMPQYGMPQVHVPESAVDFELPPYELIPAGEVRGLVVGERARPAVGAVVEVAWNRDEGRKWTGFHHLAVRTGPDGRFVIPGVPRDTDVELLADQRGWRTPRPRTARVGETVILHVTQPSGVAMGGRVLDSDGRPAPGAQVHLRRRRRIDPRNAATVEEPVEFESGTILTADATGLYTTPKELDPDSEYAAYASAPGYLTSRTLWTSGQSGSFQVLRLRPMPR